LRAFEYRVNDEDSELLGTAIILEVMITRHHLKTRRQVRVFFFKKAPITNMESVVQVMIIWHHLKTRRQVKVSQK
jgi:hypothetical protein